MKFGRNQATNDFAACTVSPSETDRRWLHVYWRPHRTNHMIKHERGTDKIKAYIKFGKYGLQIT